MMKRKSLILGVAAVVVAVTAGFASASTPSPWPMGPAGSMMGGSMGSMMGGTMDAASMDAMHNQMKDQMPAEYREQCDAMHKQMSSSGHMSGMMGR